MMRALLRILALALLALAPAVAMAAPAKPLFASEEVIHITLKGPLPRAGGSAEHPTAPTQASLIVMGAATETLPVTLAPRGITRLKTDVCQFPPLRVEFNTPPGAGSLFAGQKKLKLVTHCRSDIAFQKHLLLEYSAYHLNNVLTPLSFRVRLAQVDYVDDSGKLTISRLGYFMEDPDDVARRNGLREAKGLGARVAVSSLSPAETARGAVFEYMIGNLDWAMNAGPAGTDCCHNIKLIAAKDATTGLIPLTYDYDFSGLVDAPYATPPDNVHVSSVRTRRYRGFCVYNADAQAAAADMLAKRQALMAVFDGIPQMDAGTRAKGASYLASFFDQIGSDKDVADKLLRTCLPS